MTTAAASALDLKPWSVGSYTENGVSEDAQRLCGSLHSVLTDLLRGGRRRAFENLELTFTESCKDNWDGYGAVAVQPYSYDHAARFLAALPSESEFPEISVDPDGEISFTWQRSP